jgi:spore coat polysaccharide biosynthesis protein SpsF
LKIGVIIQARLGSSRLPGKTMKIINDKPLLYYSYFRSKKAPDVNDVIIATTTISQDDAIVEWCKTNNIPFYRGSEENVLERYYETAKKFDVDIIVRVTSDCPFVDPEIITTAINLLKSKKADYVSNRVEKRTWPHGLDIEVFTFDALKKAYQNATKKEEIEHVTPYIMKHKNLFKLVEFPLEEDLSYIRLTVDYPEDFELAKKLIEEYSADNLKWKEILDLLDKNKGLLEINYNRNNANLL